MGWFMPLLIIINVIMLYISYFIEDIYGMILFSFTALFCLVVAIGSEIKKEIRK